MFALRDVTYNGFSSSASFNVASAFTWTLAGLANGSTLASVFDQYRMVAADVTLRPRQNVAQLSGSATSYPLYTAIDYDNATAPTQATIQSMSSCAVAEVTESIRRVFIPHAALAAYTGAFTGYTTVPSPWVDSSSSNVIHYGLKYFIQQASGVSTVASWDTDMVIYVEFRNVI